jgi:2-polyprenyl-6-methoxyphenol hydroxylase-like FAD-dependent oxidoreductase
MYERATTQRTALIIGAGIAGPVLAMFLQRAGITPIIFEARPRPDDEAGAFLNLAPNGLAVLDTLDVGDAVRASGTPTTSIVFRNHHGKQLGQNAETTLLVKRGILNKTLREQATQRGIAIEFGKRLASIEVASPHTVIAHFDDGSTAEGDLLVGCDGIHSRTRQAILPDAPQPSYTGVIDSGGFTHRPSDLPADGIMRMTFGLRGFFGYQVAPSGEIYWFENFTEPTEPDRAQLDAVPDMQWRVQMLERHRDDHVPIPGIIGATEGRIGRWPVYDLPSLPTWHRGRVVLIGDAAHATSPHVGQGASLAMEDAIVLAQCLRDIQTVEDAFAAFERLRRDRVERLVAEARRMGNQKAPSNSVTRGLRDLVLPFFLKLGVKQAQRVYAYRVDWDRKVA